MESGVALFLAFLVNVAVMSVSGTICSDADISAPNEDRCKNITLNSAAFLLKNSLGNWSSKVYAVSLLASGQSSTVTGTYAGQYIMQGFLDMKMEPWLRNLITRCIAITPSLVASIIGGASGAGRLIIIASMILSFELPFALIPLLKFTSSKSKMGQHMSLLPVTAVSWILGLCMIGINMYFLSTSSLGWLTRSHLPTVGSILGAAIVFPSMMLYMGLLVYLTFRKETVVRGSPSVRTIAVRTDTSQLENEPSPEAQELEVEIECREDKVSGPRK